MGWGAPAGASDPMGAAAGEGLNWRGARRCRALRCVPALLCCRSACKLQLDRRSESQKEMSFPVKLFFFFF